MSHIPQSALPAASAMGDVDEGETMRARAPSINSDSAATPTEGEVSAATMAQPTADHRGERGEDDLAKPTETGQASEDAKHGESPHVLQGEDFSKGDFTKHLKFYSNKFLNHTGSSLLAVYVADRAGEGRYGDRGKHVKRPQDERVIIGRITSSLQNMRENHRTNRGQSDCTSALTLLGRT